jgi:hypothetical protein
MTLKAEKYESDETAERFRRGKGEGQREREGEDLLAIPHS